MVSLLVQPLLSVTVTWYWVGSMRVATGLGQVVQLRFWVGVQPYDVMPLPYVNGIVTATPTPVVISLGPFIEGGGYMVTVAVVSALQPKETLVVSVTL